MKDAEQVQQKINTNALLMECITILRTSGDHEVAFNKLLGLVASFYDADRSYVFEFDLGSQRMSNTYEWCAEGIEAEISKLQNMDIAIVDRWIVQFKAHGEFYIYGRSPAGYFWASTTLRKPCAQRKTNGGYSRKRWIRRSMQTVPRRASCPI